MGSTPGRARRLESAISICLLVVLFLIGVGVFVKQFDTDMSRFGIEATTAGQPSTKQPPGEKEKMLLSSLTVAGFETLPKTEAYSSENLYEKINGKAPLYVESGFQKLFTQRFSSKDDEALGMELYVFDMGTAKNAFSVYSRQKRAGAPDLPDRQFAYRTSNALYFAQGKYYVEFVGFSESEELFNAMTEVAQKLRSLLLVDEDVKIAELDLFPRDNIVPGTFKLHLNSAFGFEGLTDTFTAQYKLADETITAFFSRRSDLQDAKLIAESYYNFLIDNGGEAKPAAGESLKNLKGKIIDFYGTIEIVFSVGQFVAGIHEADDQQAAERLAEILINRLNEVVRENSD